MANARQPNFSDSPETALTVRSTRTTGEGNLAPYKVAVVMPTILRPTLMRAARSVFGQDIPGRCQLLIGIDKAVGDFSIITELMSLCPDNWTVTVLNLGYSTSVRHGGLHLAKDGGALRTILSYAAHSRYVAYLDDDNWWAPNHLTGLFVAIQERDYAYSLRWFVDQSTNQPLVVDQWESVGPARGMYRDQFGGFIDPNTLMIDKTRCEDVLPWWSRPLLGDKKGMSADRHVFHALQKKHQGFATNKPTCFYVMDPNDGLHPLRLRLIQHSHRRYPDWDPILR